MVGQRIGYIRVSTIDQNVERQLEGIALDRTLYRQGLRQRYQVAPARFAHELCTRWRYGRRAQHGPAGPQPRAAGMRPLVVRFPGEDISRLRLLANSRSQTLSALLREILAAYCRQLQHDCALTKPPLWHDVM